MVVLNIMENPSPESIFSFQTKKSDQQPMEKYGLEKFDIESFFQNTWPNLLSVESKPIDFTNVDDPQKRAEILYAATSPSLDAYIEQYSLPTVKEKNETDEMFFERLNNSIFELNNSHHQKIGWGTSWPATAIEMGWTECDLGSLILGRALQLAGYKKEEIEYGLAGLGSHAVIIVKNKYIDQANGVMVDVIQDTDVDGVKTFQVQIPTTADEKTLKALMFRRIAVCTLEQGTSAMISNLGAMISRLRKPETLETEKERVREIIKRFKIDTAYPYGDWAKINLLSEKFHPLRMAKQGEWKKEMEDEVKDLKNEIPIK